MEGKHKIVVHIDGGSRGNPGPAAFGVVIEIGGDTKEYSESIGIATNNQAEYSAAVFALKKVKQLVGKEKAKQAEVEIHLDSELLTKQVNGQYKVLDEKIQKLFLEVWNLRLDFAKVTFNHVLREKNQAADRMVNLALDRETNGKLDL